MEKEPGQFLENKIEEGGLNLKLDSWNVSAPDYYNWNVGEGGRYRISLEYKNNDGKTWRYEAYQFFGNGYGNNNSNIKLFIDGHEASEEEWEKFRNTKRERPDSYDIEREVFPGKSKNEEYIKEESEIKNYVNRISAMLEKALGRALNEEDLMWIENYAHNSSVDEDQIDYSAEEYYLALLNEAIEKNGGIKKETIEGSQDELKKMEFKI